MKEQKHVYYFDFLRIAAMLGVIYMHTCATPLRGELNTDWELMNVLVSLCFTAVPLFFMMSGYLLLSNEKTDNISILLKNRLPRLLCPLAVWTLVAAAVRICFKENATSEWIFKKIFYGFHGPVEIHFWYMYALIALYMVSPFIRRAVIGLSPTGEKYLLALLFLPTARNILMAFMPEDIRFYFDLKVISEIEFVDGNLAVFILGYFLGKMKLKIKNSVLFPAAAVLLFTVIIGTHNLTATGGIFDQTFQNQSAGFEVLLAAAVFLIAKNLSPKRETMASRILSPFISLSLPVYLMHNLVIICFLENGIEFLTFGNTLWYTFLNFIICIVILFAVASVKPLCFAFTGMSYENACKTCNAAFVYNKIRTKRAERYELPEKLPEKV